MLAALHGRTFAVTGGSGFIGRRLIRALIDRGASVRVLLRSPDHWGPSHERIELRQLDLGASAGLDEVLAGVEAVCHGAAFKPPDHHNSAFAAECFATNALGTLSILESATRMGVRRVVFLSTNIYAPLDRAAIEGDPVRPSSHSPHYLLSKACGDYYADLFGAKGPLQTVILRIASVYGPGMAPIGLVPTFAVRLLRHESVRVTDGGRWRVDLVHVADVVRAAIAALSTEVTGIFNVASGTPVTTLEVAEMLVDLLGQSRDVIVVDPPAERSSSGLPALDITRARHLLEYSPMVTRAGLQDYLTSLEYGKEFVTSTSGIQ